MEKVCVAWQNQGWTKVTIVEDWEKVKDQVIEKPSFEKNRRFPRYLVIEIEG